MCVTLWPVFQFARHSTHSSPRVAQPSIVDPPGTTLDCHGTCARAALDLQGGPTHFCSFEQPPIKGDPPTFRPRGGGLTPHYAKKCNPVAGGVGGGGGGLAGMAAQQYQPGWWGWYLLDEGAVPASPAPTPVHMGPRLMAAPSITQTPLKITPRLELRQGQLLRPPGPCCYHKNFCLMENWVIWHTPDGGSPLRPHGTSTPKSAGR